MKGFTMHKEIQPHHRIDAPHRNIDTVQISQDGIIYHGSRGSGGSLATDIDAPRRGECERVHCDDRTIVRIGVDDSIHIVDRIKDEGESPLVSPICRPLWTDCI